MAHYIYNDFYSGKGESILVCEYADLSIKAKKEACESINYQYDNGDEEWRDFDIATLPLQEIENFCFANQLLFGKDGHVYYIEDYENITELSYTTHKSPDQSRVELFSFMDLPTEFSSQDQILALQQMKKLGILEESATLDDAAEKANSLDLLFSRGNGKSFPRSKCEEHRHGAIFTPEEFRATIEDRPNDHHQWLWYDGNDLYELDDYNDLYGDSLDKDLIILSREGLSEYGLVEFREGFRNNAPEHYDEAADMASEQPWIMPQNWAVRGEWFKRSISPYQMGVRWAEHTFNKLQSAEQKKVHTDGILYQSAYHGTPHRFSKFTLDHIGTGEGAQAHGYGLYFAMDKEVADGYRERFRGRRKGQLYEVEIPESSVLLDEQKSLQEQPKEVQQALRSVFDTYSEEQLARIKKERLQLVDPRVWSSSEMGRLEVQRDRLAIVFNALRGITEKPIATEIKSPSNPFSRSPLEIYERRVERLRRFYTEEQIAAFQLGTDEWKAEMASMQSKMDEVNKQIFENNKILQEQANAYREKIIKASGVELLEMEDDGSWIYNAVVLAENGDPRMASIRLNEAGIKGITYDGETDGRCFVLFDEKSIEILRTFYQFAGEQGASQLDQAEEATKRMDSLTIARKMEQEGKDATAVKLATGWERGADNFWRYEIDDSGAKYHPEGDANTYRHHPEYVRFQELQIQHINGLLGKASWTEQEEKELIKLTGVWGNEAGRALEQLERGHSVLEDVLIHETLFDAYPILRRIPVRFQENGTSFGSYRGINQGITLAPRRSDEETFKSLMHEVQHAIQEIEGFAAGGNTEAYAAIVHVEETYKRAVSDARELLLAKYAYEHTPEYAEMAQTSFTSPEMQQKLDRLEATLESKKFTPLWDAFHEKYKGFDPLDFGTVNDGKFIPKDSLVAINHALKKIGSSYEFYKKHMGEVEARNVEARLSMTTEARLASLARDTEDVARKDQFFIRRGVYALCMESDTETMTADQKLSKDVAAWEETTDKYANGTLSRRKPIQMLSQTPLVFQLVGAKNVPVVTHYSVLDKVTKSKHSLPLELIKQIPAAMTDPIMIIRSTGEKSSSDITLMLDLKDRYGATIVVPVIFSETSSGYELNIVPSMYPKSDEKTKMPRDHWFTEQVHNGLVLYKNTKKMRDWARTSKRLLLGGNPNPDKQKVYSEADLVNLKKQFAGYYAERNRSVMGSYRQFSSSKEFTNGVITFFESADISTAGHEIGHWLRQVLETSAILQDGQGTAFNDWKAACDFVGADLTQSWSREQEEIFADAFVAYLKEGHAPNKFLARAFDCLKNWLTNLYARLTGNELVAVSPEIAHVFDNLLTPEQKEPIVGQHRDVIKERILKATSEVKKPYSEAQAEAYADIVDCTLQAFAQRTGIDYQQVCDRLTPTFVNNQNAMDDPDQYDALLLQPAFHGSSYHFDKFSSKFIGEGSGEQSHGYGLYFSKAPKVADDYRKNHSFEPNTIITINGKDYTYSYTYGWMPSASEEERHILDLAEKHKNKETIIKILQRGLNEERNLLSRLHERKDDVLIDRTRQNIASYQKKIDLIKKAENFSVRQTYGQLYEVEIPDDSLLLDEGKTFDAQPEKVQRGLRELGIGQQSPKLATEHDHFVSGRHLYEELVKRHGSPRAASEALASVGIKGITYESEIDGQCFVIFDEKSIEVLKKFYQQRPRSSLLFQSAYHGTPHHFDSFSMDHIGDGEGALAHGWGLYFAQDSEIANKYREELTRQEYYANGMKLEGMDALAAEFMFDSSFYSPATLVTKEEALEQARLYAAGDASYLAELSEVLERLYGMEVEQREPDGQLFQVEIPDDSVLLDEDKTFYEQPEEVQRGLRELGMGQLAPELSIEREVIRQEQLAIYEAVYGEDDFLRSHPWFRPDIYEQDGATPEAVARYEELSKREMELNELENQAEATCFVAGRFLYEELVKKHGSARAASEALASVGIKGITYEGDQDGRCFVLFDEKSIKVLKTFYQRENSVLGSYRQFSASSAFSNGVITFFESADISTAGHEIGHWLRQVLETSAILQDGQGTALNDWKAACDFVGADLTQPWSREQEEIFADAFVAYLKDGHAPNKFLARAFDSLKNWLTNLYARLTGNELVAISPEIAHIFDNLLTPEQQEPIVGQHRDVIKERILEATCNGNLPYMEAQAEAYADIVDCTLQAFAQRTGIDYQQVCDRLTPSFSGQQNALEDPDPVALLLQPAFHGTPHRFETFSMAHIGEGEGAQAHGYGLYFAKQREVGEQYRRRLVNTTFQFTLSGRPLGHWFKTQFESASTAALQQAASGNFELLKENLQPTIEIYREHYTSQKIYYEEMSDIFEKAKNVKRLTVAGFLRDVPEKYKDNFERIANRARKKAKERGHRVKADDFLFEIEDTLGNIKYHADRFYSSLTELENFDWNNLKVIAPQKGQLFEVELPELSEFLDENQPLENQPEIVQAALRKLIGLEILSPEEAGKKVEELRKIVWEMPHKNPREEGYLDYCKPIELGYMYMAMAKSFLTGKAIYKGLARIYGSPRVASEVLNAEGVKGITYDGKQDGRCFVLFDEKSVEVLRTFYQQKPQGSLLYQSAYHGTPHRFEAFSMDHIGAGEGAQTHGYGLYFAQQKDVGEAYRETLVGSAVAYWANGGLWQRSAEGWKNLDSGTVLDPENFVSIALDFKDRYGWTEDAIEFLKIARSFYEEEGIDFQQLKDWQAYNDALKVLEFGKVELGIAGQLFHVQIPEDDVLLDEQLSFDDQPEFVKKGLLRLGFEEPPTKDLYKLEVELEALDTKRWEIFSSVYGEEEFNYWWGDHMAFLPDIFEEQGVATETIERYYELGEQADELRDRVNDLRDQMRDYANGGRIYDKLVDELGTYRDASEALNSVGIKGITYEGRKDGKCFVLFDEKSIKILEKFYQHGQTVLGSYQQFSASPAFSNGVITFFESADISTAGHEIGHWLRQVLETSAILQDGQGTALNDWKAACDFVGADLTQPWSREQEEIFADAFVSYLKEGHAPNKFLARAFDSLKNWLTNLYARLAGNELVAVSPDIAHVFDNLLTPEQQELIVGQHRDAIKEQILTATANGEKPYSEVQAEAYADIVDCTLQAFAQRTGMDYQQVCDRLTPTFSETSKNIEAVRQKFFDSDEWRKAPNGAISNLTETQWMLVRTPEFKSWFGDWEHDAPNASKILDQNGEPRVVYHGTSPIMHFAEFRQSPFGSMGEGSYFTTSKETAEHHSRKYGAEAGQENLYNVFLNIRSPLRLANPYEKHPSDMSIYDGIIADDGNGGLEILAKAASQIKSADRNIGLFSKDNPNIYYQSSKQGDRVMAEAQSDDQQAQAHTLSAGQEAETTKKGIVQTFSEKVALKVIEKLQAGEIPWRKDWNDSELRLPYNPTTNKLYRGGNVFFLMLQDRSDPRWLTYKQAEAMGAQVRKGEKSTPIIFWKTEDYFPKLDENGEPILDEKGKEVKQLCQLERPRPFMSHVFNAEQIDGMPPLQQEELTLKWEPFEVAEEVLANSGADIVYGGNRAFYRINNDRVYLPERERFDSQAGFYSTALHELGHWTGHETRLARDIANTFGSPDYAREELRAELASAVMCMEIGVPNMQLDNNAAYIGGWIKALKNDPREILRAASDAEKIRRFLVEPVLEQRRDRKNEQTIEKEKIEEKTITHYYQPKHTYDAPEERQEVFSFINLSDEEKIDAIIYMQEESMFVEELDGVDSKEIPLESAQAVAESHDLLFTRNGIGFLKDECVAEKEAVRTVTPARTQKEHEDRQYLSVSYKEKAEVKKLGAKWDRQEKRWYAPSDSIAEKCAKWLKAVEDRNDAQEETRELKKEFTKALAETDRKIDALKRESGDRLYLVVPYKEKNEAKKLGAKWDKVEKSWYADLTAENREELLSRFTQWLPEVSLEQEPAISPTEELQEHLEEMGAIIPEEGIKLDGQEHTLEVRGQEKTITYTATTETPLPSGNIRDENGSAENWTYRGAYIAPESVQALEVQKENHKQELYADIDLKATRAGHTSLQRLASLPKATGKNPYLVKNGICVHEGMREDNGVLVVPMQDICQKSFLTCDLVNETYSFAKGGNAKGKFYVVDDDELSKADVIIAASSVADACIIKEVTGYTTVASVDLGNMATVAKKLHEQYPDKAIIAAAPDINFIMGHNANDILFKSITGIENISVVTPSFGLHNHDFDKQEKNRLSHWSELPQTRFGKDGVKTQIVKAVTQILERVNVKSQVQEQTKKNTQTMSR